MIKWEHFATVGEGEPVVVDGLDVWKHTWTRVIDSYGKTARMRVYSVSDGSRSAMFAAGEFSNGVWGFCRARSNEEL